MAKIISYKMLVAEINYGTDDQPDINKIFQQKKIRCSAANLEANEEIAKREAYNGEYTVDDDGQPEPATPETGDVVTWGELNAAYEAGYDEGYTEGVNSAYDQ